MEEDKRAGELYLSLGLDISELNRGFQDAGAIVADNMAKLQQQMKGLARELRALDNGMHVDATFSAEEIKEHNEAQARQKSNGKRGYNSVNRDYENYSTYEWDSKDLARAAWGYKKRLANVQADLSFGDDEFAKEIAKLNALYDLDMERFKNYEEGKLALSKYYAARMAQIEKERNDKITQRVKRYKEELEDLRIELDYADDAYKKALAQLELWREHERGTKNFLSDEEGAVIDALYFAKLEQIENGSRRSRRKNSRTLEERGGY